MTKYEHQRKMQELDGFSTKTSSLFEYRVKRVPSLEVNDQALAYQAESPQKLAPILSEIIDDHDKEHFIVLNLDNSSKIKGYTVVSVGLVDRTLLHPREVFRSAIIEGASSIIVAHNHPSGDPKPSLSDIANTEILRDAGDLIGIPVVDHVIFTDKENYCSLRSSGRVKFK